MEKDQRDGLQARLGDLDGSLGFLALMIFSLYLSWQATALQREALCRYLAGEGDQAPDVFPLRLPANAIVVGALTYFFGLTLENWRDTRGEWGRARRSADLNLWAALLVLAAALIRLYDLACVQERAAGGSRGQVRGRASKRRTASDGRPPPPGGGR